MPVCQSALCALMTQDWLMPSTLSLSRYLGPPPLERFPEYSAMARSTAGRATRPTMGMGRGTRELRRAMSAIIAVFGHSRRKGEDSVRLYVANHASHASIWRFLRSVRDALTRFDADSTPADIRNAVRHAVAAAELLVQQGSASRLGSLTEELRAFVDPERVQMGGALGDLARISSLAIHEALTRAIFRWVVAEVHWEGALGFTYSSEQGRRVRVAYTINGQLLRDIYGELERERGPPLVPRQEAPPPPLNRGRRGRRGREPRVRFPGPSAPLQEAGAGPWAASHPPPPGEGGPSGVGIGDLFADIDERLLDPDPVGRLRNHMQPRVGLNGSARARGTDGDALYFLLPEDELDPGSLLEEALGELPTPTALDPVATIQPMMTAGDAEWPTLGEEEPPPMQRPRLAPRDEEDEELGLAWERVVEEGRGAG